MISKIKLIKTYPNSPELGTEYLYNEKYKVFYCKDIKYTNSLDLVLKNLEYYEIIYEPKFKVGDFVTDLCLEGFIIYIKNIGNNKFNYQIEFNRLKLDGSIMKDSVVCFEEELQIASDTIKLFDKLYFKNDVIWKCAKSGRKQPKEITIKLYLDYIKSNNLQHFEIFETETQAKEWFENNEIRYSKKDMLKIINNFAEVYNVKINNDLWII